MGLDGDGVRQQKYNRRRIGHTQAFGADRAAPWLRTFHTTCLSSFQQQKRKQASPTHK